MSIISWPRCFTLVQRLSEAPRVKLNTGFLFRLWVAKYLEQTLPSVYTLQCLNGKVQARSKKPAVGKETVLWCDWGVRCVEIKVEMVTPYWVALKLSI